jgi:heme/copper-type cytochrome/quinol oxidase subunit 2
MDQQQNVNPQGPVVPVSEWIITMLIASIPVVGQIMLFVWGFGSGTNPSKANWAKATLLFGAIAIVLVFLIFGLGIMGIMSGSKH